MSKVKTKMLLEKVDTAVEKYGADVVSVDYNELTGMVDVNQCHHNFSDVIFPGVIRAKDVDFAFMVKELNARNVGYCWM